MVGQITNDPETIMQQFRKKYPQSHLILTLGNKGSYYCDQKGAAPSIPCREEVENRKNVLEDGVS